MRWPLFVMLVFLLIPGLASAQGIAPAPGCGGGVVPPRPPMRAVALDRAADTIPVLDLLVGYSPDAIRLASSEAGLKKRVEQMVSLLKVALRQSGTGVQVRLVGVVRLSGNASGNLRTDLDAATARDGKWDELHEHRERLGADLVSVLVSSDTGGTQCGLGWLNGIDSSGVTYPIGSYGDYMFSVVSVRPKCTNLDLVHEIGHNLGLDHDRENAFLGPFEQFSGYGFRFFDAAQVQQYRTIMAYAPGWQIPFFSNVGLTYRGSALGESARSEEAAVIAVNASSVAAVRGTGTSSEVSLVRGDEPSKIDLRVVVGSNRRRFLGVSALRGRRGVSLAKIELLYALTRNGNYEMYAGGLTNGKGLITLKGSGAGYPAGFYRACIVRRSGRYLCSKLVQIR